MRLITEAIFLQYYDEDYLFNIKNIKIIEMCGRGLGELSRHPLVTTHTISHFSFRRHSGDSHHSSLARMTK